MGISVGSTKGQNVGENEAKKNCIQTVLDET